MIECTDLSEEAGSAGLIAQINGAARRSPDDDRFPSRDIPEFIILLLLCILLLDLLRNALDWKSRAFEVRLSAFADIKNPRSGMSAQADNRFGEDPDLNPGTITQKVFCFAVALGAKTRLVTPRSMNKGILKLQSF